MLGARAAVGVAIRGTLSVAAAGCWPPCDAHHDAPAPLRHSISHSYLHQSLHLVLRHGCSPCLHHASCLALVMQTCGPNSTWTAISKTDQAAGQPRRGTVTFEHREDQDACMTGQGSAGCHSSGL